MSKLGRKIVIYGPTCSGKSTLAKRISQLTAVHHIELDGIFWQAGWVQMPLDKFRAEILAVIERCPDGWILDGNYSRVRDLTLPLADTIIWLRPPLRVAFWRLLKRTVTRCKSGTLLWGTNYESWRAQFLSRDSLLLYQLKNWRRYGRMMQNIEGIPSQAPVIQFHSQKEIDTFLNNLRAE